MTAWYVARGGQTSGPLSEGQVRQMASAGQLGTDAYVAGPGLSGWVAAGQVPMLATAAAPYAPPAPAAPAAAQPMGAMPGAQPMGAMPGAQPMGAMPGAMPMGAMPGAQPMGAMPGASAAFPLGMPGASAAFPLGMPGQVGAPAQRGERKSGWIKERLRGLLAVGIAVVVFVLNVVTIMSTERFYPKTLILGFGALGYGGWVMIFGDEFDDYTLELVKWKQIGMYACAVVGALIGIALSVLIAQ